MDELDDLSTYNGDTVHDMWVDYDYHQHTHELSEYFDEDEEQDDELDEEQEYVDDNIE